MSRIFSELRTWLVSQILVLSAVVAIVALYLLKLNFFSLNPLLAFALCSFALIGTHSLNSIKAKVVVALSLLLIAFLPIFPATLGLALLTGVTYLLEDEENSFFFFLVLVICLIENLPGLSDQIGTRGFGADAFHAAQLLLLYFVSMKGVKPERAFVLILLALSSQFNAADKLELAVPLLFLISLLSSFRFGLNKSLIGLGFTLAICGQNIGLALVSMSLTIAEIYLHNRKERSQFELVLPLFLVLALFNLTPEFALIILSILIIRIAANGGMKVCLSKSHL